MRGPTLREGPLMLRPMDATDERALAPYFKDPELVRLLGLAGPRDDAFLPGLISSTIKDPAAIYETVTFEGRPVGYAFLDHIDFEHRHAVETGVLLGDRALWGRRIGRAAFGMLLEHGVDEVGLHRASLAVLEDNVRAIHAYEALGFRHEGRRRQSLFLGELPADTLIMGVLAPELNRVAIDEAIATATGLSRTPAAPAGGRGGDADGPWRLGRPGRGRP